MTEPYLIADPDCDRCDPLAVAHGVVASLAMALDAWCEGRTPSNGERRQRRALVELASALAIVFPHRRDREFMEQAVPPLVRLMRRADRRERYGVPHLDLVPLPGPLPANRLRIDMVHLPLAGVMRLKLALEKIVVRHAMPRRVAQLRIAVALEDQLRRLALDLVEHRDTEAEAVRKADELFGEAEDEIGNDLAEIFEEASQIIDAPRRAA